MTGGRVLAGLGVVAVASAVVVTALWRFQRWLIYLPEPRSVPAASTVLPGAEEVSFRTEDGVPLEAWFLPAPRVRPPARAPAVLVCNGNGGNRALRAPLAAALSRAGLAVLLFDYRGYGRNPGAPSEDGLAADARAAQAWLAARDDVDPARLVYFGESLGAAVALRLATERPPAALVLRSPFTSLAEVGRVHYPFLPVGRLLTDRYPSEELVGGLTVPLLVVAGERDRIVPAGHSRRLYDAAPQPKRYVAVPGADHNDLALLAGRQLIDETVAFLREHAVLPSGGR